MLPSVYADVVNIDGAIVFFRYCDGCADPNKVMKAHILGIASCPSRKCVDEQPCPTDAPLSDGVYGRCYPKCHICADAEHEVKVIAPICIATGGLFTGTANCVCPNRQCVPKQYCPDDGRLSGSGGQDTCFRQRMYPLSQCYCRAGRHKFQLDEYVPTPVLAGCFICAADTTPTSTTLTVTTTTTLNPCAAKDCGNGNCNGNGICVCSAGWDGADCNNNINDCAGKDCGNGGCEDKVNAHICNCKAGWGGSNCKVAGGCTVGANGQACVNAGAATGTTGKCKCECVNSFTGANCEIAPITTAATTITATATTVTTVTVMSTTSTAAIAAEITTTTTTTMTAATTITATATTVTTVIATSKTRTAATATERITTTTTTTATTTTEYSPANVDCVEDETTCTAACEASGQRNHTVITPAAASGRACVGATDCKPGDGLCPLQSTLNPIPNPTSQPAADTTNGSSAGAGNSTGSNATGDGAQGSSGTAGDTAAGIVDTPIKKGGGGTIAAVVIILLLIVVIGGMYVHQQRMQNQALLRAHAAGGETIDMMINPLAAGLAAAGASGHTERTMPVVLLTPNVLYSPAGMAVGNSGNAGTSISGPGQTVTNANYATPSDGGGGAGVKAGDVVYMADQNNTYDAWGNAPDSGPEYSVPFATGNAADGGSYAVPAGAGQGGGEEEGEIYSPEDQNNVYDAWGRNAAASARGETAMASVGETIYAVPVEASVVDGGGHAGAGAGAGTLQLAPPRQQQQQFVVPSEDGQMMIVQGDGVKQGYLEVGSYSNDAPC